MSARHVYRSRNEESGQGQVKMVSCAALLDVRKGTAVGRAQPSPEDTEQLERQSFHVPVSVR
jgi:hypothetical protein